MRVLFVLAVLWPLQGCAFLESSLNAGARVDPNRIYLGRNEVVGVQRADIERYGCWGMPLICRQRGVSYDCHCP